MTQHSARQSFLGNDAPQHLRNATVAVIGLGGGGSHVVQQLAHVGVGHLLLFDPDHIEESNLNRLVGGTAEDVKKKELKVAIARRLALGINPEININAHSVQWQVAAESLRTADVIVSCVDSYVSRQDIEVSARRFLAPLVDIGMDVHVVGTKPHISGQVIASVPGGPCFRCLGFLTDENLRAEAELYGAAGGRPQVIWPNGVLASIAVGIVVQALTGWQCQHGRGEYLHFDGNQHLVTRSARLQYAPASCQHFESDFLGEPSI